MSLNESFLQGLNTPLPVAGAGLPTDLTLYAGGPLDPLKQHEEKYKQLARMQRMSDSESKKLLAALGRAEHTYGDQRDQEEDMDKISFVSSNPLLRRQYLMKAAEEDYDFSDEAVGPDDYTPPPAEAGDIHGDYKADTPISHYNYLADPSKHESSVDNYNKDQQLFSPLDASYTPEYRAREQKDYDTSELINDIDQVPFSRSYKDQKTKEVNTTFPRSPLNTKWNTGSYVQNPIMDTFNKNMSSPGSSVSSPLAPPVAPTPRSVSEEETTQRTLSDAIKNVEPRKWPTKYDKWGGGLNPYKSIRAPRLLQNMTREELEGAKEQTPWLADNFVDDTLSKSEFTPDSKNKTYRDYIRQQAQQQAAQQAYANREKELKDEEAYETEWALREQKAQQDRDEARQAAEEARQGRADALAMHNQLLGDDSLPDEEWLEQTKSMQQKATQGLSPEDRDRVLAGMQAAEEEVADRYAGQAAEEARQDRADALVMHNQLLEDDSLSDAEWGERTDSLQQKATQGLSQEDRDRVLAGMQAAEKAVADRYALQAESDRAVEQQMRREDAEERQVLQQAAQRQAEAAQQQAVQSRAAARDARLEEKVRPPAAPTAPTAPTVRGAQDQRRSERGYNTAFRRAQGVRDLNQAFLRQELFDPEKAMPAEPVPEPGFWDKTKGFFGDVGDSLKGMGTRAIRQGTQGLQQAANYGLRNVDWLEGMVDDDQEARILASLAQGSTGDDRTYYLNQLRKFTDQSGKKDRTQKQQARMEALSGGGDQYSALRNMHLEEQARKKGHKGPLTSDIMAKMEKDYGPAFDMYYGRGAEAERIGINPLEEDSFGTMYGDARDKFQDLRTNAFRRAKKDLSPEDQLISDPKGLRYADTVAGSTAGLSADTQDWMMDTFPDIDYNDPVDLGVELERRFNEGDPTAMQALEYMAADLPPAQMTRVLMTAMPQALSMGEELSGMSDEEVTQYIEALPPGQQDQLDGWLKLTAKYIAPQMSGQKGGFGRVSPRREATDEEIAEHGGLYDKAMQYLVPALTSRTIDTSDNSINTEIGSSPSLSAGPGTWFRVPGAGIAGSAQYFNPQTGKFNREWLGRLNPYNLNIQDLPPRYQQQYAEAAQRAKDSWLPTPGLYF